jgi:hypothetical protein
MLQYAPQVLRPQRAVSFKPRDPSSLSVQRALGRAINASQQGGDVPKWLRNLFAEDSSPGKVRQLFIGQCSMGNAACHLLCSRIWPASCSRLPRLPVYPARLPPCPDLQLTRSDMTKRKDALREKAHSARFQAVQTRQIIEYALVFYTLAALLAYGLENALPGQADSPIIVDIKRVLMLCKALPLTVAGFSARAAATDATNWDKARDFLAKWQQELQEQRAKQAKAVVAAGVPISIAIALAGTALFWAR